MSIAFLYRCKPPCFSSICCNNAERSPKSASHNKHGCCGMVMAISGHSRSCSSTAARKSPWLALKRLNGWSSSAHGSCLLPSMFAAPVLPKAVLCRLRLSRRWSFLPLRCCVLPVRCCILPVRCCVVPVRCCVLPVRCCCCFLPVRFLTSLLRLLATLSGKAPSAESFRLRRLWRSCWRNRSPKAKRPT